MTQFALLTLLVASFVAFTNWRLGLPLVVVVGLLLQDPMRKLAPGQPVYYVLFVGVVFIAACLGAFNARVSLMPSIIPGWRAHMGKPFNWFVLLVVLQAVHSFAVFWDARMTGIGLMVWLAPVPALMFTFQLAGHHGNDAVNRWLLLYVGLVCVCAFTVVLQFIGVQSPLLGEVGAGIKIYDVGTVLVANSGLLRSSELAAWHMAAAAALVFVVLVAPRFNAPRLTLAFGLMGLLFAAALLTGRRKAAVEVMLFLLLYFFLLTWYTKRSWRQLIVLGAMAGALLLGLIIEAGDDLQARNAAPVWETSSRPIGAYEGYAMRGGSALADIPDRVAGLGIAPIAWAVNSLGWFGSGLGTGSQSTGGFDDVRRNLGAAEGGLGKIVVELGVPGLLLLAWLGIQGARFIHRGLEDVSRLSAEHARTAYGVLALLIAKACSFSVASQAFSDPFVLLMLGSLGGYLLALPLLARAAVYRYRALPGSTQSGLSMLAVSR